MNTKQWTKFFEKDEHTQKQIDKAERSACSFYKCAAGCRLQEIYHKTEKELKLIPYNMLYGVLSEEAYLLSHEFYGPEWDKTNEQLPERIKEIFERLNDSAL